MLKRPTMSGSVIFSGVARLAPVISILTVSPLADAFSAFDIITRSASSRMRFMTCVFVLSAPHPVEDSSVVQAQHFHPKREYRLSIPRGPTRTITQEQNPPHASPAARRRDTGVPEQYPVPTHRFRLLGLSRHDRYRVRFQDGDAAATGVAGPGESESALGSSTPAKGSTKHAAGRSRHVVDLQQGLLSRIVRIRVPRGDRSATGVGPGFRTT